MLLHLFGEIKSGAEQNRREEKRREQNSIRWKKGIKKTRRDEKEREEKEAK